MPQWTVKLGRRRLLLAGALGSTAVLFTARAGATGTRGIAWQLPEHRTAAQLAADGWRVRAQVDALASPEGRERAARIVEVLRTRQDAAGEHVGVPFDRYRPPDGGPEVLVARGQLTVRASAVRDGVPTRMTSLGYARAGGNGQASATAIYRSAKAPVELARDVARLRAAGVDAAMNVVVPLGHTIKGDDHPTVTQPLGPPAVAAPAARVRVAVVDTGVGGPRGDGWLDAVAAASGGTDLLDIVSPIGRLDWGSGHGTFTAGIVRRVAPGCEIVVYRFTRADGLGTDVDAAETLLRAAREGHEAGVPTIVNASFGAPGVDGVPPRAMREAVTFIAAMYPEVLVVASAGNAGTADPVYPAAFESVVAVGALAADLSPAPFSSHGSWVDCSTVGVGVVSTFVPGLTPPQPDPRHPDQVFSDPAFAMWTGTSFSAPQISGAVARLCAERPGLAPRDALDALLNGQARLPGHGRILRLLPGTPSP